MKSYTFGSRTDKIRYKVKILVIKLITEPWNYQIKMYVNSVTREYNDRQEWDSISYQVIVLIEMDVRLVT